jgi:pyrimidine-nucleoside phosphorylase
MTAFLMAVAINGLGGDELAALTSAMIESGEQWKLRERFPFIADKHSTGGVGDKVSIVLTPWVAACGVNIAMLSGRGLGHTGGTLDKLDTIPGFEARLTRERLEQCVSDVGCAIATSTDGIAPADRRMYALRDVTGTVESIPLITASIMSKKLAMGASALVLDVKTGSGAFMSRVDDARRLARSLIAAAHGSGTRVEALLTNMDRPLGVAAGNANEIAESFEALAGRGPADLMEVTRAQAVAILVLSGAYNERSAGEALDDAISSGRALEKAREWVASQGGDPSVVDDPSRLPQPDQVLEIKASRSGFIQSIDTFAVGNLAVDLGAGRRRQDDPIDPAAGIMFDANVGDEVTSGTTFARIFKGPRSPGDDEIRARFAAAVETGDDPPAMPPMVLERISETETMVKT